MKGKFSINHLYLFALIIIECYPFVHSCDLFKVRHKSIKNIGYCGHGNQQLGYQS